MSKNTFFKKRVSFLVLDNFRSNHYFYGFFQVFTVLVPNNFLAKTDSVHENAVFFSLPDTNSVRQFSLKIHFFIFSFLDDHLKNTIFIGFGGLFLPCLFLLQQHKKDKNKKCNFFSKTSFLTSRQFRRTQIDTIFVFKHAPKTLYKWVKNSKNNLDQF